MNAGNLPANALPPPEWMNTTTLMMRNLPNKYTQRMLLTEVNETGFLGTFDFLYLPIDPETNANRGYAFLNFIDSGIAWMFRMFYEGRKMARFNSNKVVSVMPATLQGFDANYAHYSSARVNRGDPSARPLFLREPSQPFRPNAQAGKARGRRRANGPSIADSVAAAGPPDFFAPMPQPPSPYIQADVHKFPGIDVFEPQPQLQQQMQQQQLPKVPAMGDTGSAPSDGARKMVPKFCPHCGASIQPHFQFCPACGKGISFNGFS